MRSRRAGIVRQRWLRLLPWLAALFVHLFVWQTALAPVFHAWMDDHAEAACADDDGGSCDCGPGCGCCHACAQHAQPAAIATPCGGPERIVDFVELAPPPSGCSLVSAERGPPLKVPKSRGSFGAIG